MGRIEDFVQRVVRAQKRRKRQLETLQAHIDRRMTKIRREYEAELAAAKAERYGA